MEPPVHSHEWSRGPQQEVAEPGIPATGPWTGRRCSTVVHGVVLAPDLNPGPTGLEFLVCKRGVPRG